MKPAQLLLQYQRLVERERALSDRIAEAESRLRLDPEVARLERAETEARSANDAVAARLRDSDHTREDHRARLRSREKELMSGRIRNPTELMQMSQEVQHMKARFVEEEEAELRLMEDADTADRALRAASSELSAAIARSAAEEPALREELGGWRTELADVVSEKAQVWAQVPAAAGTAFSRLRVHPPVAEVHDNQCTACHVTVTSSGMQTLRKGDELVHCDNCGRILVLA